MKVPGDKNILLFSALGMSSREVVITGETMDVQLSGRCQNAWERSGSGVRTSK